MTTSAIHRATAQQLLERVQKALTACDKLPEALDLAWDWTKTLPRQQSIVFTDADGTDTMDFDAVEAGVHGLGVLADDSGYGIANVPKDSPYGQLLRLINELDEACALFTSSTNGMRHLTTKEARALKRAYDEREGVDVYVHECEQVACNDLAYSGPFCDHCRRWLESHPGTRTVPAERIAERVRLRNYRARGKVHVTGPLAEDLEEIR